MRDMLEPDVATPMPSAHAVRPRRAPRLEYRIYFALIFVLSLPVALTRWLLPRRRNRYGLLAERRTIFGEARAMARAFTPILFAA
ncbi:MAG: cytochrome PufQ [Pseudomonadota bacterium]